MSQDNELKDEINEKIPVGPKFIESGTIATPGELTNDCVILYEENK